MEQFISTIRQIRLKVDICMNSVKLLTPSREVSSTFTALQLTKSWLGEMLKNCGTENPYPKSTDATSPVIEKQAEHSKDTFIDVNQEDCKEIFTSGDQTARVKFFRFIMDGIIHDIESLLFQIPHTNFGNLISTQSQQKITLATVNAWQYAINSKIWLGWELNSIREKQIAQS